MKMAYSGSHCFVSRARPQHQLGRYCHSYRARRHRRRRHRRRPFQTQIQSTIAVHAADAPVQTTRLSSHHHAAAAAAAGVVDGDAVAAADATAAAPGPDPSTVAHPARRRRTSRDAFVTCFFFFFFRGNVKPVERPARTGPARRSRGSGRCKQQRGCRGRCYPQQ